MADGETGRAILAFLSIFIYVRKQEREVLRLALKFDHFCKHVFPTLFADVIKTNIHREETGFDSSPN